MGLALGPRRAGRLAEQPARPRGSRRATRSSPAPTQTTSPVAQSWSSCSRPVAGDTPRQHLRLPEGHRQRQSLERHERLAQRRAPVDRRASAGRKRAERRLLGRLDLLAQGGERRAPQPAQDVGVAPLALGPAGSQLAADEQLLALELREQRLERRGRSGRSPRQS